MDQNIDYRTHFLRLKNQNQYLKLELQEFHFREKNLKKQLEIMSQVQQQPQPQPPSLQEQILKNENQQMKQQLIFIYKQRQQLQQINQNHLQKINDLKYNNAELKKLNQKITHLHHKEIEIIKKQNNFYENSQEKQRKLQKEIQILNIKLQSCGEITKQMENYYMSEIRKLKDLITNQQQTIQRLKKDQQQSKTHRSTQLTPKLTDSLKQNNQKWEKTLTQFKEQYQNQIKQLKNKIKFLVNKLQSIQECQSKVNNNQTLIQSKMIQSNSSIQSFRFTPNSSASSNKECIQPSSRRNTSNLKPYPNSQKGKNYIPLGEKNHY